MPVGNLTNILVRDGGYRGVMLLMRGLDQAICAYREDGEYFIDAQAGAALAKVVSLAAAEELTGLEFCTGIPGSVGGAVLDERRCIRNRNEGCRLHRIGD